MFILLFIFGIIVGSFLNVVSLRYSSEKSIFNIQTVGGRSHCLACKQTLRWHELMPLLSFLIQRGKCNYCGAKISWQYPLVELAGGIIFLLPIYIGNNFQLPTSNFQLFYSVIWMLIFLTFLLIWAIDYRLFIIPDELNLSLAFLGLILIFLNYKYGNFGEFQGSFIGNYSSLFGFRENIWLNHLVGALAGGIAIAAIILLSRGKGMGWGDLKFMAALGVIFGWPDIILILMLASIIGAIASIFLMIIKTKNLQSAIPFGPFLAIGSLLTFFFGNGILRSYFNFFGL